MPSFLTRDKLDAAALIAEVASDGCGATAVFLGTVRSAPEDGPVTGIEYSAYPEMAEQEFARIIAEALGRWPMARIALRHRLGWVGLGEASIAIAVASPHRAEAYEASRYVIEETKKRVPIWKKEKLAAGTERWAETHV
jgi:molybdopterin synthase catalytic subunit